MNVRGYFIICLLVSLLGNIFICQPIYAGYIGNLINTLTLQELQRKADAGDPEAQLELGNRYCYAEGVARDYSMAFKYWLASAKQGNRRAQCYVGLCYNNGDGVAADINQALYWYHKAAKQGDGNAEFMLALHYTNTNDRNEAMKWMRRAAESGHPDAQCILGAWLIPSEKFSVHDCNSNPAHNEARKWLLKAKEQGHPRADALLNNMYKSEKRVSLNEILRKSRAEDLQMLNMMRQNYNNYMDAQIQRIESETQRKVESGLYDFNFGTH